MVHDQQRADRPQVVSEPKPPFPSRQLDHPGLESQMPLRPRYEAPRYRAAGKLDGRRALVTGGDSGIGRAVTLLYAREGADVAIVHLPEEQADADEVVAQVAEHGRRCVSIPGDVSDPDFCARAVERTVGELGGLDILVSNAAYLRSKTDLGQLTPDEWDRTFRTNVYAYYYLVRAALPELKAGGSIIVTTSEAMEGDRIMIDYGAAKDAALSFTKSLAQQLAERGIRVNAIAPGPTWTALNLADERMSDDFIASLGTDTPMGRPAQPEEIAPAYVFLASDADSSYVTGEVIAQTGGYVGTR